MQAEPHQRHSPQHVVLQVRAESSGNGAGNGASEYDFDLFTLGAGSGGTRASRMSGQNHGESACADDLHTLVPGMHLHTDHGNWPLAVFALRTRTSVQIHCEHSS